VEGPPRGRAAGPRPPASWSWRIRSGSQRPHGGAHCGAAGRWPAAKCCGCSRHLSCRLLRVGGRVPAGRPGLKDDARLGLDGGDLNEPGLLAAQAQLVVGDAVDHRVTHGGAAQRRGDPAGDESQVAQALDEGPAPPPRAGGGGGGCCIYILLKGSGVNLYWSAG